MNDDLPRRPLFVRLTPPAPVLDATGPTNGIGKITAEVADLEGVTRNELDAYFERRKKAADLDGKGPRTKKSGINVREFVEDKTRSNGDGVALTATTHPPGLIDAMACAIESGKLGNAPLIGLRLSVDLLARLDAKRGDAGRQEFIRGILEFALPKLKTVP